MTTRSSQIVLRHLRDLAGEGVATLPDRELLERFAARRDEAAFAALVRRHGPLVLGVCRRVLGQEQDAEDVFQATFLVLAKKADGIRQSEALGAWLYQVAYRLALRARARLATRRRHEQRTDQRPSPDPLAEVTGRELLAALDEELHSLPDHLRVPLVLCYLQSQTRDQAAGQLGWSLSTLQRRLEAGRECLRSRLARRGLALGAGLAIAGLSETPGQAAVPAALVASTVEMVLRLGTEGLANASVPAAALADAALRSPTTARLALAGLLVLTVGIAALGVGLLARPVPALPQPEAVALAARALPIPLDQRAKSVPQPVRKDNAVLAVAGQVLDMRARPVGGAQVVVVDMLNGFAGDEESRLRILGQVKADRDGKFRLRVRPAFPGRRSLVEVVAGASGHGLDGQMLDPDKVAQETVLRLPPEQIARGRLIDLQGAPAGGVKCRITDVVSIGPDGPMTLLWGADGNLPFWPQTLTSDQDGRLTVRGLGPGQSVSLDLRDDRFARTSVRVAADKEDPKKELTQALEPAQLIQGRVTYAATGKPAAGARLAVSSYFTVSNANFGTTSVSRLVCDPADSQGRFRLNPYPSKAFTVEALAPAGQPYLGIQKPLAWPAGAVRQTIDLALPRGVLLRGQVTEGPSGKPVAGARIIFHPRGSNAIALPPNEPNPNLPRGVLSYDRSLVTSGADGRFTLAAPPVPGHLLVMGPGRDYVAQAIGNNELYFGKPGGMPRYYHAALALDLKPGELTRTVQVTLRRGVTLHGRVVGPDGQPVASGAVIAPGVLTRYENPFPQEHETTSRSHLLRDGWFELHGCEPGKSYRLFFLKGPCQAGGLSFRGALDSHAGLSGPREPQDRFGAVVDISRKEKPGEPVLVRLAPCGSVKVRFLDSQGKPDTRLLSAHPWPALVITPGPALQEALAKGTFAAEAIELHPPSDGRGQLLSPADAEGRITMHGLIPGATYRVEYKKLLQEFTAEAGKMVDLGDISVPQN